MRFVCVSTETVCVFAAVAYDFLDGSGFDASTVLRTCWYDTPLVTLTAHISFSFFQTGHCVELVVWSGDWQLRHLIGAEQGEPS